MAQEKPYLGAIVDQIRHEQVAPLSAVRGGGDGVTHHFSATYSDAPCYKRGAQGASALRRCVSFAAA